MHELCRTRAGKGAVCRIELEKLRETVDALWRERKYLLYSNPSDMVLDAMFLVEIMNAYSYGCASFTGEAIEIGEKGLEFLREALSRYSNLVSPELKSRLPLVLRVR